MTRKTTFFRAVLPTSLALFAFVSTAAADAQELPAVRAAMPAEATGGGPTAGPPAPAELDRGGRDAKASSAVRDRGFVPVLRAGLAGTGKGTSTNECEGELDCSGDSGTSYEENDSQMLQADFLWHTGPKLRLGFGASYVRPRETVDGTKFALGTEIGLFGVMEGVFPTSDSFALTLRGQVGALLLIPGEDLSKAHEAQRRSCRESDLDQCNTFVGPFVGRTTAVGFGGRFAAGPVGVRLDTALELYSVQVNRFEATSDGASAAISTKHTGLRSWLLGGIEL